MMEGAQICHAIQTGELVAIPLTWKTNGNASIHLDVPRV